MAATRTQIYFTQEQCQSLDALAKRQGKTLAGVVRAAVDAYVAQAPGDLDLVLDEAFGSMPDLEVRRLGHRRSPKIDKDERAKLLTVCAGVRAQGARDRPSLRRARWERVLPSGRCRRRRRRTPLSS